jgi:hypothetical protein
MSGRLASVDHRTTRAAIVLTALVGVAACTSDINPARDPAARGTLGVETYGVLCDRIGANAFPDDLTGASFHAMCHAASDGTYAATVDTSVLPAMDATATDAQGNPVPLASQQASRTASITRMKALAAHRVDLVGALDATFPATLVPALDLTNANAEKSCGTPADPSLAQAKLTSELSDLLGRMTKLYDDGTLPQATEALGRLMNAFGASTEGKTALSHFDARQGYRPQGLSLGAIRPAVGYPALRDLANTAIRILSADSDPYDPAPRYNAKGERILVPGPAYAQWSSLLAAAHEELRTATADPAVGPLTVQTDLAGRPVPSRPRGDLEMMSSVMFAQDPSFGTSTSPSYIVQRDARGYASVALSGGKVPAPFVDSDGDGLADIDASGHFVTGDGSTPPDPFLIFGGIAATPRDAFGRAVGADGTTPVYNYLDTGHAYTAAMLADMSGLFNPDPKANHETMMNALAGAYVLFGTRDGSPKTTKTYAADPARGPSPVTLAYDAFHTDDAAVLDLVYAAGQVLADPSTDALLGYTSNLLKTDIGDIARLTGAALDGKAIADAHPEAGIPATSTFWDEMLDVFGQMAAEPGLLEDVLRSFADPNTLKLANAYGSYAQYLDQISYDPANMNGPTLNLTTNDHSPPKTPVDRTKPETGLNRSDLYRFIALIHDTDNVAACNKDGAVLHARDIGGTSIDLDICGGSVPVCSLDSTPFSECQIFKIDNLALFYLDSIIGKASLYFRPNIIRNGLNIAGYSFGASTVDTIEASSQIGYGTNDTYGFWDGPDSQVFRPRPQYLDRLVFFNTLTDSTQQGDTNYTTNHFLTDLQGPYFGTAACAERTIPDPVPTAPDASPDGMVHGLRTCNDGDYLQQRDPNTIFTWESFDFYDSMTPLLNAYSAHGREDLFLSMIEVLYRHWGDKNASASECKVTATTSCSKDGIDTYEPILSGVLGTDAIPALNSLATTLVNVSVPTCTASDANGVCTATTSQPGIQVFANAVDAMLDPAHAAAIGLVDRHGGKTAPRNDGTTNPQVTPVYLLVDALDAMDNAFTAYAKANPSDTARQTSWRSARSQLVDTFLTVNGRGPGAAFADPLMPKAMPNLVDTLRSQLLARCPQGPATSSAGGNAPCAWAKTTMTQNLTTVVGGPLFASTMDLGDAMRSDTTARQQLETLMVYLVNASSQNQALPAMQASTNDVVQYMQDDTNMVPLLHVLAEAASASVTDAQGNITQKSLTDASMALLARLTGRALDASGVEVCASETDPEQVLTTALRNLVTPMATASFGGDAGATSGALTESPLEVMMDVIADVNRTSPITSTTASGKATTNDLTPADYAAISAQVEDFLTNQTSGLEQFYEIVRRGTGGTGGT